MGVDLVRGDYRFNFAEASIGSGRTELSLIRVNNSDAFSQWDQIALNRTWVGTGFFTRVTMPDGSDELFDASNVSIEGNGSTLEPDPTGPLIYGSPDGTQIHFYNPVPGEGTGTEFCTGSNFPCKLLPQKIRYPNNRTITFTWTVVGSGTNHAARIESIASNDGYSIAFTYQSNTPGTSGWSRRASSAFKNGATVARTVGYAYPSAGTTDITDATNNVWRVTATSIRRPNEVSPALSISASAGIVASVGSDGVTTSYARSVNGNNVSLTRTTAGNSTVVAGDLGIDRIKSITNAVGKVTSFNHDTIGRLTKVIAPEGNSVEYLLDDRGNSTETKFAPKTGSSSPVLIYSAAFAATCDNEYTCNKATSVQDPAGIAYTYSYGINDVCAAGTPRPLAASRDGPGTAKPSSTPSTSSPASPNARRRTSTFVSAEPMKSRRPTLTARTATLAVSRPPTAQGLSQPRRQ